MPTIDRDGVSIYYEVHGSGPPLLLTHGYSSTSGMWQGQIAALSKHHKLVLWDMRGHGQSGYPEDTAAYSEALTVADMAALLDAVGAETAIVGGLSLGGYMSLAFYRAHPNRVRALLIIDTGPGFKKDEAREAWNKRAHDTGDRFEREGLEVLKSASRERSSVTHRDASGLARAARGMLTQRDARVIEVLARYQGAVADRGRRRRHAVPGRLRLHGGQDSRRAEGGDPGRRPRRQHRPAAGLHRRRAAVPRRPRCQGNRRNGDAEGRIMKTTAVALALIAGSFTNAAAQKLPPIGGPYPPPFTETLSNNTPLAFGMDADEAARALGTPLNYVRGRPGEEIFLDFPQHRRQRIVLQEGPALSAIPQRQAGRLEGRLGRQLDVAVAAAFAHSRNRLRATQNKRDDPWDRISN